MIIGLWKLNGQFYGWFDENCNLYSHQGNKIGTFFGNAFHNHNGVYIGDLIHDNYIGYNPDHADWIGPICNIDDHIPLEPLLNTEAIEVIGYTSPD